jgi:hypothetical protein
MSSYFSDVSSVLLTLDDNPWPTEATPVSDNGSPQADSSDELIIGRRIGANSTLRRLISSTNNLASNSGSQRPKSFTLGIYPTDNQSNSLLLARTFVACCYI